MNYELNKELKEELNGLNFTNTSLEVKGNASTLVTSVTNPTSSAIEVRVFDIIVKVLKYQLFQLLMY